jgi:hypothetical protein
MQPIASRQSMVLLWVLERLLLGLVAVSRAVRKYENQMEDSLCRRTLHCYVTYHSVEILIGLLRYFFFFFAAFFFAAFFFFAISLSPPFG